MVELEENKKLKVTRRCGQSRLIAKYVFCIITVSFNAYLKSYGMGTAFERLNC